MYTLLELAELVNGDIEGDGALQISGVADLDHASSGDISFVASLKNSEGLKWSKASAFIVPNNLLVVDSPVIRVDDPYLAVAIIHNRFLARPFRAKGIHPTAVIGNDCKIDDEVTIGPHVSIGDRVTIGRGVYVHPGVVVEDDVCIAEDVQLKANCTVGYACKIGKRVILHAGVVVGSDGFGYATDKFGQHIKRPQVGNVVIEDDVEIGSNTCLDRATFGTTLIKQGAKIDNLVQIAHNVVVGENSIIVSQAGIAGSSSLGRNVVIGGQVGISGHIHIGAQAMVGSKSGVHNHIPEKTIVSGYPAVAHKLWLRTSAIIAKLPELAKDVRTLKKDVARLLAPGDE
nr:UDP-3-O-(3-hydroxymyristoyl)glucosamine N-acyltransferase [Desulfobulbaceae bacterium]